MRPIPGVKGTSRIGASLPFVRRIIRRSKMQMTNAEFSNTCDLIATAAIEGSELEVLKRCILAACRDDAVREQFRRLIKGARRAVPSFTPYAFDRDEEVDALLKEIDGLFERGGESS
jgi:hypothetical protein